jgi:hypothetical protein
MTHQYRLLPYPKLIVAPDRAGSDVAAIGWQPASNPIECRGSI